MDQATIDQMYPKTALEALEQFESGKPVSVIDLGGMGPGYEQAIWNAIFMMIKDRKNGQGVSHWIEEVDGKTQWAKYTHQHEHLGEIKSKISDKDGQRVWKGLHLSGAQAETALTTSYQVLHFGWQRMMVKVPKDRRILIDRDPPKYGEVDNGK